VARYPTPAVEALLPQYRAFIDPENKWIPWFWSEHGISYNTSLVPKDKAPKDWAISATRSSRAACRSIQRRTVSCRGSTQCWARTARGRCSNASAGRSIIQRGHTQRMELMLPADHMMQGTTTSTMASPCSGKSACAFAIVTSVPILATNDVAAINRNAPNPYAGRPVRGLDAVAGKSQAYSRPNGCVAPWP